MITTDQEDDLSRIREAYVRPSGLFGHYGAESRENIFDDAIARVRAEAVAPVLALHKPRDEQAISGDCAAEECEHEDECPTIAFAVCAECYRVAEESDPYFGERGLSSVEHPCPTFHAASTEQETKP